MILQCMKCDLYYRSFARIKIHKALQCKGEIRDIVKSSDEEADIKPENDNPWSYNLDPVKAEESNNNTDVNNVKKEDQVGFDGPKSPLDTSKIKDEESGLR